MHLSSLFITHLKRRIVSLPELQRQTKRSFFFFPNSSQSKIKFNDSSIVQCPQSLLFEIVADVHLYNQFVPNCFESTILERKSPELMRAKLTVGIPQVISADYISTVQLTKPNRILTRSEENRFMRFLESEWQFEPITIGRGKGIEPNRTLVKFRVEFEMYSQLTANLVGLVFDDFTHKTMAAFLTRAEAMHRRNQRQLPKPKQGHSSNGDRRHDNGNDVGHDDSHIPRR